MTTHHRTEIYKAGWTRGFYDCRNDEGMASSGPAGIPEGPGREEQLAEYWSGYFSGRAAGSGRVAVKLPLGEPGAPELNVNLTLKVLTLFVSGSSIESIASEMKTSASRVELRLQGAFAAVLRFLAQRSAAFNNPAANNFEEELLVLAIAFGPNGRYRQGRNKAA